MTTSLDLSMEPIEWALSLRDVWCYAAEYLHKGVENRKWKWDLKVPFAIHLALGANRGEHDEAWTWMRERSLVTAQDVERYPGFLERPRGHLTAVTRILDIIPPNDPNGRQRLEALGIEPAWWWTHQYGYALAPLQHLQTPVPCRGAQRFFRLKPDVTRAIRETGYRI